MTGESPDRQPLNLSQTSQLHLTKPHIANFYVVKRQNSNKTQDTIVNYPSHRPGARLFVVSRGGQTSLIITNHCRRYTTGPPFHVDFHIRNFTSSVAFCIRALMLQLR